MKKTLVLYYSYSGNTRKIADRIKNILDSDIAEIETVEPYTGDYDETVKQGHREVRAKYKPKIRPITVNISDYNVIVLGTPVWWYTFAPAVRTFLSENDLSGKTVYPFATNGGWLGHTFEDIRELCPGADVHAGLDIRFDESTPVTPLENADKWASDILKNI